MSNVVGELDIPAEPDRAPGVQRDVTLTAIVRMLDNVQHRLATIEMVQAQIVANQQWVNSQVLAAVKALSSIPGIGAQLKKVMNTDE